MGNRQGLQENAVNGGSPPGLWSKNQDGFTNP